MAMPRPTAGSSYTNSTRAVSSGVEFDNPQSASSCKGMSAGSHSILSKGNTMGVTPVNYDSYRYRAKSMIRETNSNTELDGNETADLWRSPISINTSSSPTKAFKRHVHQLSEVSDVDGLSDNEMCEEPKSFSNSIPKTERKPFETGEDCQDIDLDDTFDADMAMILGTTSDMELVMPNFDDEYLEDLKNDPVLAEQSRRPSTISSVSSMFVISAFSKISFRNAQRYDRRGKLSGRVAARISWHSSNQDSYTII
ncbi:hypothetical protein BGX21_002708 [Mortierella sp. AD011]|nr:hypothetical protein BGX20_001788 [Mortierella sp. AD010]KAF9401105.1 hypothetical protein BGX21_002708 [Mortierella sp. AD011]